MVLHKKIDDAIVRRAGGRDQGREFGERLDGDEDRAGRHCGAGGAIGHPDRDRCRAVIVLNKPHLTTMAHAAPHENRLAMQRMPAVMNGDVLSVVGRI